MLLGGLWHGASWSFVLWGGLHGLYLVAQQAFRAVLPGTLLARLDASRVFSVLSWALTLLAVIVAWVFFRAEHLAGALRMVQGMLGIGVGVGLGLGLGPAGGVQPMLWDAGLHLGTGAAWCVVLGAIALLPVNSNRIGHMLIGACTRRPAVRSFVASSAVRTALFLALINTARESVSAFIYFNF